MSAATAPAPAPAPVRAADPSLRVTAWRVVVAQWVQLRSVRSTVLTLLAAVVVAIGLGVAFAGFSAGQITGEGPGAGGGPPGLPADLTSASLAGFDLAALVLGVVGALTVTSEYATGMIRVTLAAVPRRLPVLWAKAVVVGAVALALSAVAALAAFGIAQLWWADGTTAASFGDDGVLGALLGAVGYSVAVAVMGVAIGALLRGTALALVTLFGLVFLAPALLPLVLPSDWGDAVSPYLPSSAGDALMAVVPAAGDLGTGAAAAVLAGYVVVLLGAAAVVLRRRDA